jgi:hypothetical protein
MIHDPPDAVVTSHEDEHDRIQRWYAEMCQTGPEPPMTPPEFRGLYGHVVTSDCYGLRTMDFEPDVILDIGASPAADFHHPKSSASNRVPETLHS